MPTPGYMTKTHAVEHCREKTKYGRRAVERKMEDLEREGLIRFIPDPGNPIAKLISQKDVEKVVAAFTLPPAE